LWIWVDKDESRANRMAALYGREGISVRPVTREQDLPEDEVELVIMTKGWDDVFAKHLRERYRTPVLLSVPGGTDNEPWSEVYDEVVPCPAKAQYLQTWATKEPASQTAPAASQDATPQDPMQAMEQWIESNRRKQTYTNRQSTIAFERPTQEIAKRATIITVGGVKGGVGKTTFAILLASNLHKKGARTVVVDLDHMGNLARLLKVEPLVNTDRFEVLANSLNDAEMEQNMIRTAYGFWVIPRGKRPLGLSKDGMRRLVYLLSHYADYLILDTHPGQVVSTIEAIREADVVCAVSSMDRSTWADLRDFFSVTEKPVKIVLNRTRERQAVNNDVKEILSKETGYPVIGALPEDEQLYAQVQAGEKIEGSPRLEAELKAIRARLFGNVGADATGSKPLQKEKKKWLFR
jgi:MinD-like ATPase involved in chromosome partitioning or flagellar assembly